MYRMAKTYAAENGALFAVGGLAFAAQWNLVLCHRPMQPWSNGVVMW